jgi:hypothetical protein
LCNIFAGAIREGCDDLDIEVGPYLWQHHLRWSHCERSKFGIRFRVERRTVCNPVSDGLVFKAAIRKALPTGMFEISKCFLDDE